MSWWRPWDRRKRADSPRDLVSIGDPAAAELFRMGNPNYSGVVVGESSALGVAAFFRAVSLIAGAVARLPLKTVREEQGIVTELRSVFDDPGGVIKMTPFEWKETVILHQIMHGNAFLAHVYNVGGGLAGLIPVHPLAVQIDPVPPARPGEPMVQPFGKTYSASLPDGSRWHFTDANMTHCPGLSLDGRRGLSLLSMARNSLGIAVAGDRAAAKMFSEGALISGLVVPEQDETVDADDVATIRADLDNSVAGWENAGKIALVNRRLKFSPWTMSNEDAQFLQSRQFQVEEIARWTGVPPHLLMQTEKQTSWGTGVAEQNRGLSRFTLANWTTRLEQRLSRVLTSAKSVRFDFTESERPTPEQELDGLLKATGRPIMTVNEARAARGWGPIPGGDVLAPADSIGNGRSDTPAAEPQGVPA